MSLYTDTATLGAATTAYTATNEVANSGNYTAGGQAVVFTAPSATGTTAFTTPNASVSFTTFTAASFSAALLYNSTQSNKSVSVHTFGVQSITAGTFTLTMPTNAAGTALINLA